MTETFERDAAAIEEALHEGLPGGTYDHLFVLMLKRKASYYTRSYGNMERE